MSISKKEINEEGFSGVVYTLACDTTGEKMLDIIARSEDVDNAPVTKVSAKWVPQNLGSGSGQHEFSGLLSYGPIDVSGQKTEILDMSADETEDGEMQINVYVSHNYNEEDE